MQVLVEFMRANQEWAIPIVFLVAFAECVAILSWLVPATVFFTAFGAVAGASGLNLMPLAVAASAGAGCGFWVSYWAGLVLGPRVDHHWPFNKNPQLLARGHAFFEKWGVASILIGHFFGPLRAVIAIVAGIVRCRSGRSRSPTGPPRSSGASACFTAPAASPNSWPR